MSHPWSHHNTNPPDRRKSHLSKRNCTLSIQPSRSSCTAVLKRCGLLRCVRMNALINSARKRSEVIMIRPSNLNSNLNSNSKNRKRPKTHVGALLGRNLLSTGAHISSMHVCSLFDSVSSSNQVGNSHRVSRVDDTRSTLPLACSLRGVQHFQAAQEPPPGGGGEQLPLSPDF